MLLIKRNSLNSLKPTRPLKILRGGKTMTNMDLTRRIQGSMIINHRLNMITCSTMGCTMVTLMWTPYREKGFVSTV